MTAPAEFGAPREGYLGHLHNADAHDDERRPAEPLPRSVGEPMRRLTAAAGLYLDNKLGTGVLAERTRECASAAAKAGVELDDLWRHVQRVLKSAAVGRGVRDAAESYERIAKYVQSWLAEDYEEAARMTDHAARLRRSGRQLEISTGDVLAVDDPDARVAPRPMVGGGGRSLGGRHRSIPTELLRRDGDPRATPSVLTRFDEAEAMRLRAAREEAIKRYVARTNGSRATGTVAVAPRVGVLGRFCKSVASLWSR